MRKIDYMKINVSLLLIAIFLGYSVVIVSAPTQSVIVISQESMLCSDIEYEIDLTIGPSDYLIYDLESIIASSWATFKVEYEASSPITSFFTSESEAHIWEIGYEIIVPSTYYFPNTLVVSKTRTTNYAGVIVFENTSDNSIYVTGTITIDKTPPSISINLEDGAIYNGTIRIEVSASDSIGGVENIQVIIDGKSVVSEYENDLVYQWQTNKQMNGNHSITVRAEDIAGNFGSITIIIGVSNPLVTVFDIFLYTGFVVVSGVVVLSVVRGRIKRRETAREIAQFEASEEKRRQIAQTFVKTHPVLDRNFSMGLACFRAGDYVGAAAAMNKVLLENPNNIEARKIWQLSVQKMYE